MELYILTANNQIPIRNRVEMKYIFCYYILNYIVILS